LSAVAYLVFLCTFCALALLVCPHWAHHIKLFLQMIAPLSAVEATPKIEVPSKVGAVR
jgi:hypothetical protein